MQSMSEAKVLQDAEQAGTDFLIYTGNFCGYCTAAKRPFRSERVWVLPNSTLIRVKQIGKKSWLQRATGRSR